MLEREASESALDLVAIPDRGDGVRTGPVAFRQRVEVRCPAPGLATLGVAASNEDPVRPGLEASWFPELGQLAPHLQQGLLRGVLGEVDVAKDPLRHRVQPVAD